MTSTKTNASLKHSHNVWIKSKHVHITLYLYILEIKLKHTTSLLTWIEVEETCKLDFVKFLVCYLFIYLIIFFGGVGGQGSCASMKYKTFLLLNMSTRDKNYVILVMNINHHKYLSVTCWQNCVFVLWQHAIMIIW